MEEVDPALKVALSMYVNEPCRVCGEIIQACDLEVFDSIVFAGYSDDLSSRTAHKECFDSTPDQADWAMPNDFGRAKVNEANSKLDY